MELLIQRARRGDTEAFEQLIRGQMQDLYKIASAYLRNDEDAADVIQETILTCYERLDTLQKNAYSKTWLTRILINKCKDLLRRRRPECSIEEAGLDIPVWEDFSGLEWRELLAVLPEDYRIAVILFYVEGFKIKEISRILDVKESTVQSRLMRARRLLAKECGIESGRCIHG